MTKADVPSPAAPASLVDAVLAAVAAAHTLPVGQRMWICLRCPHTAQQAAIFTDRAVFVGHLHTAHQLDRATMRGARRYATMMLDARGTSGAMRLVTLEDDAPLVAVIVLYPSARRTQRQRTKVTR